MKSKPIPTSPKHHPGREKAGNKNFYWQSLERPRGKNHIIFVSLLLALIFGFLAGFLASLSSDFLVDNYLSNLPVLKNWLYQGQSLPNQVIVKEGSDYQDLKQAKINNLIENYQQAVVGVYYKKDLSSDIFGGVYKDSDKVCNGLAVTSDGYLVIPDGIVLAKENFVVLDSNGKIYDIIGHWLDPVSDLAVLKIGAQNLPSVAFASKSDLYSSEEVVVLANSAHGWKQVSLNGLETLDYDRGILSGSVVKSSDQLSSYYLLNQELADDFNGSAVFDIDGKLVGLATVDNNQKLRLIFPGALIREMIDNLLKNGEIKRTSLGLNYLNIDQAVGLSEKLSQDLSKGALVYKDPFSQQTAVETGGAALEAGVKQGDIIIKVNDLEIDKTNGLSLIIQRFKPEETINLQIQRDGLAKTLPVKLKELRE